MTALAQDSALAVELRAAARRYTELARSAADGSQPLSGSAWTVREAVAHLATVAPRYSKFPHGTQRLAATPADLPALNAQEIDALGGRPIGERPGLLVDAVEAVIGQAEAYGEGPPAYRFHSGELITADVALGILPGELVVHGWDLAKGMRRGWPVTRQQVSLIWSGTEPILPGWVRPGGPPGHQAACQVHLGDGGRHVLCFTSGKLAWSFPPDAASTATSAGARRPSCSSCTGAYPRGTPRSPAVSWRGTAAVAGIQRSPTASTGPDRVSRQHHGDWPCAFGPHAPAGPAKSLIRR